MVKHNKQVISQKSAFISISSAKNQPKISISSAENQHLSAERKYLSLTNKNSYIVNNIRIFKINEFTC